MTNEQLDAIEAAAKAATPGPWGCTVPYTKSHVASAKGKTLCKCEDWGKSICSENNAAFIAAANPAVVLELIEELRREREKFKLATIRYHEECVVRDWLAMHFGKLEKCKICRELPDDIVTVQDCMQCVIEYARKNVGGEDD